MTSARRQSVRALFDRASLLDPAARAAFLASECGGDDELRAEVEALLAYDQPTANLPVPPVLDRLEDAPAPARLGPYELEERIGEGGFGTVYAARQTEPFERRVAIKLMKGGLFTRELLTRFDGERQALALLDHPGIARILDAGATESGRPYFAMELVEGEPITRYCDRERLSIDARLELFTSVCDAVQHAHRRGIIHRDLKPSNVLVTEDEAGPHVKVIDFGVAKAIGSTLSDDTSVTQEGQIVGTPESMSPEQAELGGLDVDTRTDVYALGVLLYELLTGTLPFEPERLRAGGIGEALRIVREEEPPRPSARVRAKSDRDVAARRRTSPRGLEQALAGELDWIVLRALEKTRERRYESASALALDLERHRNHEAVEAGPPSAVYRARKFTRRHRVAIVVVLALFAASLVSAVESNRRRVAAEEARLAAERARIVAERAQEESDAVSDFLASTLGASNPFQEGRDVKVVDVLDRAVATDLEEFAGQPLVRARLQYTIGEVYTRLGRFESARDLLEEALATRREELGDDSLAVADTHNLLGILLQDTDELDASLEHYERALELYRAQHGEEHLTVARVLHNMGTPLRRQGRLGEAIATNEQALALRERLLGPDHPDVARTLANLGGVHQVQREDEEALACYERALPILERHFGPEHAELGPILTNLGSVLDALGDVEAAREVLARAVAVRERTLGPDHPEVATALRNLSLLVSRVDGAEASRELTERVVSIWEEALTPDHPKTLTAYLDLALVEGETGDYAAAEPLLVEVLEGRERRFGPDHLEVANPLYYLGLTHRELGNLEYAGELLERSLAILEAHGVRGMDLAATFEGLMLVERDLGHPEEQAAYEERLRAELAEMGMEY